MKALPVPTGKADLPNKSVTATVKSRPAFQGQYSHITMSNLRYQFKICLSLGQQTEF